MKKIFYLICFIVVVSCTKTVLTDWTFDNKSSQKVYIFNIAPNGSPANVTLNENESKHVTAEGTTIDYEYGPADGLRHERDLTGDRIIFYDTEK